MRRAALVVAAALTVGIGCSGSGSSSGNNNSGPAKATVDQSALLFGLVTGTGVPVGTAPSNSVQVFNSGSGSISVMGATVGTGATSITQQLPLGPGGALVTSTLAADTTHPEYFTASTPSATSVSGNTASVIEVIFTPLQPGVFTASLSITTSTGMLTVALGGEAVAPVLSESPVAVPFADGGNSFVHFLPYGDGGANAYVITLYPDAGEGLTVPTVFLYPSRGDDGGLQTFADGGVLYNQGYSSALLPFYNTGTSQLDFQPASLSVSGDNINWELCSPPTTCTPGPTPNVLVPGYSDGGAALIARPDGGEPYVDSYLKVLFIPAIVGTYSQTITVTSDASNLPSVTVSVYGTAVPAP